LPNGNYLLGVHIADVAHYVTEGSELDEEAFERGTSVYFPGRAVPMLPERLSNGICSLNPRVDRLTFSCEIEIDPRGHFVNHRIFKSVIRTKERMTYTGVNEILTGQRPAADGPREESLDENPRAAGRGLPADLARYEYLLPEFDRMLALYEILRARREQR